VVAGKEVVEQSRPGAADVKVSGGTGGIAHAYWFGSGHEASV
jgi:hypothetical protein